MHTPQSAQIRTNTRCNRKNDRGLKIDQAHSFFLTADKLHLSEIRKQDAACEDGAYLPRDVRADGVHEKVVAGVGLLSEALDDARGHREGGDSRRSDHRVDPLVFRQEEVEDLRRDDAACGVEDECDEAHAYYGEGAEVDELLTRHRRRYGETEQYRDDVRHLVLSGLRETLCDAANAEHVAEHDETEQRDGGRRDKSADYRYHYREEQEHGLGDWARRIGHTHFALFLGRQRLDDRRLDERDERHVCICRDGNRPQQVRREARRYVYRGRPVGGSDDAYRGGFIYIVVEYEICDSHREEDAGLRREAEEEYLRVRKQRREVAHCADCDEYQQREYLGRYTEIEEHLESAVDDSAPFDYLVERGRKRKVDQYSAESHRQQKVRLKIFLHGHVHQQAAYAYHYQTLVSYRLKSRHK